jgi:hypothetical protein
MLDRGVPGTIFGGPAGEGFVGFYIKNNVGFVGFYIKRGEPDKTPCSPDRENTRILLWINNLALIPSG